MNFSPWWRERMKGSTRLYYVAGYVSGRGMNVVTGAVAKELRGLQKSGRLNGECLSRRAVDVGSQCGPATVLTCILLTGVSCDRHTRGEGRGQKGEVLA
jgi:hypothetical protein